MSSRSLLTKSFAIGTAQVVSLVTGLATTIVVARVLGTSGKGILALFATFPIVVIAVAQLGLGPASSNLAGKRRFSENEVVAGVMVWTLVLGGVVVAVLWIVRSLLLASILRGMTTWEYALMASTVPVLFFTGLMSYVYIGSGRAVRMAAIQIALAPVGLAAMLYVLLVAKGGVAGAVFVTAAVTWLGGLVWLVTAPRPSFHGAALLRLTRAASRFALLASVGQIMGLFFLRADMFFLNYFKGTSVVGVYSTATNVAEKLLLLSGAVAQAVYSHFAEGERAETAALATRVGRATFVLTGLAGIVLFGICVPLVPLIYGSRFSGAVLLIGLLVPGIVMFAVGSVYSQYFLAQLDRPGTYSLVAGLVMVTSAIAYPALIIPFGAVGGAIASSITYTVLLVAFLVIFPRVTGLPASVMVLPQKGDLRLYRDLVHRVLVRFRLRRQPGVPEGQSDEGRGDA